MSKLAKRAVIVTQKLNKEDTSLPNVAIASRIAKVTGAPYICDDSLSGMVGKRDVIFLVNFIPLFVFAGGSPVGSLPWAIVEIIRRGAHVVWVNNDYKMMPPPPDSHGKTPYRAAFAKRRLTPHFWTTLKDHPENDESQVSYVNWNQIFYDPRARTGKCMFPDQLFYYGTWRGERVKVFDRYFGDPQAKKNLVVSASSGRLMERYHDLKFVPKMTRANMARTISCYGATLYLQDPKSDHHWHAPSTKFYEILSAKSPILFELGMVSSMKKYGYAVGEFTFDSIRGALQLLKNRKAILHAQQTMWRKNYQGILDDQIHAAVKRLEKIL